MSIGFITSAELGSITDDDALVVAALAQSGIAVRPVCWDAGDPEHLDALVLRSPWNYHLDPETFLGWVDRAGSSMLLCNDPDTVRWNAHKGYLFELQRAGIPIADTVLCEQHAIHDLRAIMEERAWNQVVVKPAISASSFMTTIVGLPAHETHRADDLEGRIVEDGQHLLDEILETRDALIQPFMPEILHRGERCLIFIDGRFSHAVQKAPFTDVGGGGQAATAEPQEIALGERALAVLAQRPLYARVDLLRDTNGIDRLMELELIDPELYLRFDPDSAHRFATALIQRLDRHG